MRTLARFLATMVIAFSVLTGLLWNAPGRDLDESAWGRTSVEGVHPWSTYSSFTLWYANELVHGRAGNSTQFGVPVNELIGERAAVTAGHAWRGFAAAWFAALLAGIASHFRPAAGRAALAAGSVVLSLPSAFVVLALVLGGAAPWIGLAACVWPKTYSYWETLLAGARRRSHVLAMLAQGAGPSSVQWHAIWRPHLRQALGLLAVTVPILLGALIPVEVLCDAPGLGQLAWRAVAGRDLPLLTSLTLLFTAFTCGASLIAETLGREAI